MGRIVRKGLLLWLLLIAAPLWAADMQVYVVQVFDSPGLVAALRPHLAEGGSIATYQDKLVIRTTPENYAQLRQLMGQLDHAPRPVTISLRRTDTQTQSDSGADLRVQGDSQGHTRTTLSLGQRQRRQQGQDNYRIQALEDHDAFIGTGSLLQVGSATVSGQPATAILPLLQGIDVTPHILPDNRVRLDVHYQFDRNRTGTDGAGGVLTEAADTTLLLTPGQWQPLGQLDITRRATDNGLNGVDTHHELRQLPLAVRVDLPASP